MFAGVVNNMLRTTDIIGRIGGEEFAAFLPCSIDEATIAAERVRSGLERCGAVVGDVAVPTTVSIGMSGAVAATALDQLLASADKALYRAKTSGRNRFEIAQPEDFTDQRGRIAMPSPDVATVERGRKSMIRLPHWLPTLDPETSHLPLQP